MKNVLLAILFSINIFAVEMGTPEKIVECQKILETGSIEEIQRSGCCSWHKGVCGCSDSGRVVCCDGSLSPSCTCRGGEPILDSIRK